MMKEMLNKEKLMIDELEEITKKLRKYSPEIPRNEIPSKEISSNNNLRNRLSDIEKYFTIEYSIVGDQITTPPGVS